MPTGVYPRKVYVPLSFAIAKRTDKRGSNDCWLWIGQRTQRGYGVLMRSRRNIRVTHVVLEMAGHPRPAGAVARHKCDNPSCVNPRHLEWGTQKDNVADCVARGRKRCASGEQLPHAKLTEAAICYIRLSAKTGRELAREFGVHEGTISKVRLGRSWAHLS